VVSVRTIHPKKNSGERKSRRERGIDSLSTRSVVEIKRTDNDACVNRVLTMQPDKVTAFQSYDGSLVGGSESQNLFI